MAVSRVSHGARSALYVNGLKIGYVEGASWNVGAVVADVEELSEALPSEEVLIAYSSGSMSASLVHTIGNKRTLFDLGFIPAMTTESILNSEPYDIELRDTVEGGKPFLRCKGCVVTNQGASVQARGIMRKNVSWRCRTVEEVL